MPHTETATGPKQKGVQWQFLHGARQVGDEPVGRMSGSQKPSKVSHPPDRTRPNTSARAPLLNKRGTPNETYTMTTPFPPSPLRGWYSTPPPEPNPPRNLYQPIPPQTRNGEGGKRQDDRHGGTIGNTTPATPTAGKNYNTLQAVTISKHNNVGILCKFCWVIWVP